MVNRVLKEGEDMNQDDNNKDGNNKELDKLSDEEREKKGTGDNDMVIAERELKDMQQQLQKKKLTREELRKALLKQSVRDNYEALERLSRT